MPTIVMGLPPEPPARGTGRFDGSGEHALPMDVTRAPLLRFLLKLPLKKLTIWAGFLGLLLLLRDFFPLIFMTFVLSYMAATFVAKAEHRFSARWIPIVLFFAVVVTGVVGFVWLTVPQIIGEVRLVQDEVKRNKGWNSWLDDKLKHQLGHEQYDKAAEWFGEPIASPTSAVLAAIPIPEGGDPSAGVSHIESKSLSAGIIGHISHDDRARALVQLTDLVKGVWKGVVYVFLTIIFSLMLVWGLPNFQNGLAKLKDSRVSDIYAEVGPSIRQFGMLLGRAFEAQTLIAACNTLVTFVGMKALGIPGSFLLSVVVFVCSFIPVAGVFLSTTPIALAGLLMPGGGITTLVGVVAMVTIAHVIEAYVLNPRIYGHHMRMNPLAVLVILVIAEHTVGIWGLVVAIPLSTYIWRYVVLGEEESAA